MKGLRDEMTLREKRDEADENEFKTPALIKCLEGKTCLTLRLSLFLLRISQPLIANSFLCHVSRPSVNEEAEGVDVLFDDDMQMFTV